MDIQQNQQEQNKQGQPNSPANRIKRISSLDAIAKYAINALTEKAPSYFYGQLCASCGKLEKAYQTKRI